MKKIIYVLVVGLLIISACKSKKAATETEAAAEAPQTERVKKGPPKGGSLEEKLAEQEEMYTSLGISDAQKVKFRAIETKYAQKMRTLRDSNTGDREGMRTAMQALQNEKVAEIKSILTGDQFTKYETLLAAMRQERRGGRGR